MSTTPLLGLPLIAAAQAQKHVTHNEALYALDVLVQCAVLDKDLPAPPPSPTEGAAYIVGSAATGDWAGKTGLIVLRQDGAWRTITPKIGFLAYVIDEALLYVFTSGGWSALTDALTAIQNLTRLGFGTVADATNPFSAKLNKALWTARSTGEGGTGDLRYTLNKQGTSNIVSLLFQTGNSGRCEIGLVGSDNLVTKVSTDGTTWREAMSVDVVTGSLDFLSGEGALASAASVDLGSLRERRILVTGNATITSFGTSPNRERHIRFAGALTLTHNATSLVLPGGANIVSAAGDTAVAVSDGSGNWRVVRYDRASGKPTIAPSAADVGAVAASGGTMSGSLILNSSFLGLAAGTGSHYLKYESSLNGVVLDGYDGVFLATSGGTARWVARPDRFAPLSDNAYALGSGSSRVSVVYAGTGSINTSDARDKTPVAAMTGAEIAAARDIGAAIGTFQFLQSVAEKGVGDARLHVGLTVQRAIEILDRHGLDPFRYGFICHDTWLAEPVVAEERDESGNVVVAAQPARPAGDRYGFRLDQLALFIARGQEARLAVLEGALAG